MTLVFPSNQLPSMRSVERVWEVVIETFLLFAHVRHAAP